MSSQKSDRFRYGKNQTKKVFVYEFYAKIFNTASMKGVEYCVMKTIN